jgi:hypothetical protein
MIETSYNFYFLIKNIPKITAKAALILSSGTNKFGNIILSNIDLNEKITKKY